MSDNEPRNTAVYLELIFPKKLNFKYEVTIHLVVISPLADTDRLRFTDVKLNPGNAWWFISWGIWLTLGCTSGVINGKCPTRLHKHGQSFQITAWAVIKAAYVVV